MHHWCVSIPFGLQLGFQSLIGVEEKPHLGRGGDKKDVVKTERFLIFQNIAIAVPDLALWQESTRIASRSERPVVGPIPERLGNFECSQSVQIQLVMRNSFICVAVREWDKLSIVTVLEDVDGSGDDVAKL